MTNSWYVSLSYSFQQRNIPAVGHSLCHYHCYTVLKCADVWLHLTCCHLQLLTFYFKNRRFLFDVVQQLFINIPHPHQTTPCCFHCQRLLEHWVCFRSKKCNFVGRDHQQLQTHVKCDTFLKLES